jgi:spore maturation protein CgeB
MKRKVVVFGLSISSSWGNGHATTYRGLLKEFARRGHDVTFVECDVPWYRENRDLAQPDFCDLVFYRSTEELRSLDVLKDADFAIVGSYVPNGCIVGDWVLRTANCPVAFYDIDTPVTLAKLDREDYEYIEPSLIARYDCYFSFTGGPTLRRLENEFGSPSARPLYCSFDPNVYFSEDGEKRYDLGYMGTYSDDRQPPLDRMLTEAAQQWPEGRFVVAGPQYPESLRWPSNVKRIDHLPPREHRAFYNAQRFTLNITRKDMVQAGWSPSVRLFEAAACGVPIISDYWRGLEEFFTIGTEIYISGSACETLEFLRNTPEELRAAMGRRAMRRVMSTHTAAHRAEELEGYVEEILAKADNRAYAA